MAQKEEKRKSTPCLRNHQVAAEEHAKALNFNSRDGRMVQNHGTLKTNAFQKKRKIELFVECTDLVLLDSCTKSDPMCVLYVKRLGQWMEYGRTESIPNCFHPKVRSFVLQIPVNSVHSVLLFLSNEVSLVLLQESSVFMQKDLLFFNQGIPTHTNLRELSR